MASERAVGRTEWFGLKSILKICLVLRLGGMKKYRQTGYVTRSVTTFARLSEDGGQNMQHIPCIINKLLSFSPI